MCLCVCYAVGVCIWVCVSYSFEEKAIGELSKKPSNTKNQLSEEQSVSKKHRKTKLKRKPCHPQDLIYHYQSLCLPAGFVILVFVLEKLVQRVPISKKQTTHLNAFNNSFVPILQQHCICFIPTLYQLHANTVPAVTFL